MIYLFKKLLCHQFNMCAIGMFRSRVLQQQQSDISFGDIASNWIRHDIKQYVTASNNASQHQTIRHSIKQCVTASNNTSQHQTIRHSIKQYRKYVMALKITSLRQGYVMTSKNKS